MSKVTLSTEFRKVDVDELDEEKFHDEPEQESNEGDQVARREQEVRRLTQSNNMDALKVALEDPPVASKDKALKERNFQVVLDVLTRFRSADVEKAVKSLSSDELDILMKYIYRGFANPTENSCGILLVWHEKAVAVGGMGTIVRVMTDRKTV